MDGTANPGEALDLARRALEDLHSDIGTIGRWDGDGDRHWLRFDLTPSGLKASSSIPATTSWYALVEPLYPSGHVEIFPAREGGIEETYPHQLPNEIGVGDDPWRTGKVCLVDTVRGHELAAKRDDPDTAYERLVWHVWRTIGWLQRATHGELLQGGEPFELPVFGQFHDGPTIAFAEGPDTFDRWQATPQASGIADLVVVRADEDMPTLAVIAWGDHLHRELVRPAWGAHIARSSVTDRAVWFRFPKLLVRPPWRAPQTWQDVHDFSAEQGVDFSALLRQATATIRDGRPHYVLLGFPVAKVMGSNPSQIHWVAFLLPGLSKANRAKTQIPGFRPSTAAWMVDRREGPLAPEGKLAWVRTENWDSDELAARGQLSPDLAGRSAVMLGAGALGSVVADLLVRAGVHDLTVFDGEKLQAGNLARHELTTLDNQANKSEALAARLNLVSPSARVIAHAEAFPPTEASGIAALQRAEIIIDSTASERVARDLGTFDWNGMRTFASLSFSFGAQDLYVYTTHEASFPSDDFRTAIKPWMDADTRSPEAFPHEGTGCWSSVFPARADDVALLAAIATRQLDAACTRRAPERRLTVLSRQPDGTVAISESPTGR